MPWRPILLVIWGILFPQLWHRHFRNTCTIHCLLPEVEFDCSRLEADEFMVS